MERRKIENLGIETSLLGFGCMRFPTLEKGKIDEIEAEKMIDEAKARGINYFDTAYVYHDGQSEPFIGKVLNKYDRSSYYLATKLPVWLVHNLEDAKRLFEEQLARLDKEYIDFYLLHALNTERFQAMKNLGIIEYCEELQRQGKIRYLGFSFHDGYESFEEIITYRKWDFCQIQYNYMDTEEQAGDKGYLLAEKLGVPLIIMEPVRGGALAGFGDDVNEMFQKLEPDKSIASFALRWVASHPNVKVILSGMSTKEQVEDNLNTFENYVPLKEDEIEKIKDIVTVLRSRVQNGCTGCGYCMPCPAGVDIPRNFKLWNTFYVYGNYSSVSWEWENEMPESTRAKYCIKCGKCEKLCPQKLNIREDLVKAQSDLEKKNINA